MLRLFHSIFGGEHDEPRYPEALVRAATERAVDATDPWLRGLSGYRRKLRPAVLHAIEQVVALVDGMEAPLTLSRAAYGRDPYLRLFFISAEQLETLVRTDPALTASRREPGRPAWALLVMECEQRGVFGVDLLGDTIVRDVPQVTVSLSGHRLIDPTSDPAETRRLLKRRAFDHLLTLALARITAVKEVRDDLVQHRTLLQAKLDFLQRGDWGFSDPGREIPLPVAELQEKLGAIETRLQEFGGDDRYIEKNLDLLVEVLSHAEDQLWAQPLQLIVDRMGIRRNTASDDAPELTLTALHNAAGRQVIARLVTIPPESEP